MSDESGALIAELSRWSMTLEQLEQVPAVRHSSSATAR